MATLYLVVMAVIGVATLVGWLVGLISLFQLFAQGRRAGHSFWSLYFFGVYRFAFNEKKGSKETRRMVWGFATMVVGFLLSGVVGALLESARHVG